MHSLFCDLCMTNSGHFCCNDLVSARLRLKCDAKARWHQTRKLLESEEARIEEGEPWREVGPPAVRQQSTSDLCQEKSPRIHVEKSQRLSSAQGLVDWTAFSSSWSTLCRVEPQTLKPDSASWSDVHHWTVSLKRETTEHCSVRCQILNRDLSTIQVPLMSSPSHVSMYSQRCRWRARSRAIPGHVREGNEDVPSDERLWFGVYALNCLLVLQA